MKSLAFYERKRRTSRGIRVINVPCADEDIEKRDGATARKNETVVGTLSFPVNSKKRRKELRDNSRIIVTILKQRWPALLLCAGWSIPEQSLPFVVRATRRVGTIVILETVNDVGKTYWRIKRGHSSCMGNQKFAKRDDINKNSECLLFLADEAGSRSFRFCERSVFLLICGEVLIVKGRNEANFDPRVVKGLCEKLSAKGVVILNPTHTRMANDGSIKAKRKFLSQGGRLYLSASNWDRGGERVQKPSATLHSLWHGGKSQKAIFEKNHCDFEYREFGLSATDGRC